MLTVHTMSVFSSKLIIQVMQAQAVQTLYCTDSVSYQTWDICNMNGQNKVVVHFICPTVRMDET